MSTQKDRARRDWLIKERMKEYPYGHTLDDKWEWATKAVYKDILEGFRDLKEAREYVQGLEDDRVIYTARGYEIKFSLIKMILAHIERNPFYSPWGEKPRGMPMARSTGRDDLLKYYKVPPSAF